MKEEDIHWSLQYFYKKGSNEVYKFCSKEFINKIAIERKGILYAKSRILDTQRLKTVAGLPDEESLSQFNLKTFTPVLDRHSPLSYSIGDYIHRKITKHGGFEMNYRESLNHCFIIQGLGLFRELGEDCKMCIKLRKKYLDIKEGPVADESLTIAPPFYVTMIDIYGPYQIYVPGHAMKTRHKNIVEAKCYVLVCVCPITKCINLQVIEAKSADGVIDGVMRLCCEVGVPSLVITDQDSGIMKALSEAEVNIMDLDRILHKEKGIRFRTVPVAGHNYNGLCERKIRTVQECLKKCEVENLKLHATGLQTFMKIIENHMNDLPFGYSYARGSENSPLLKLIFPNLLRIGRNNSRSLSGPIKLPNSEKDMLDKIQKAYDVFYKVWNTSMIPMLMKTHGKWLNGSDELKVGDLVFFRKTENELSSEWTVGKVFDVEVSKDGTVRRANVRYQNANESFPRYTDRAARSLCKLMHIDDTDWRQEMDLIEKLIEDVKKDGNGEVLYSMAHTGAGLRYRLKAVGGYDKPGRSIGVQYNPDALIARSNVSFHCKLCCCSSHCQLTFHAKKDKPMPMPVELQIANTSPDVDVLLMDRSWDNFDDYENELADGVPMEQSRDKFMSFICAINANLKLDYHEV